MHFSFDLHALRRIGLGPDPHQAWLQWQASDPGALGALGAVGALGALGAEPFLARIVEVQRERYLLHNGQQGHPAVASGALMRTLDARADALAVGDWVAAGQTPASDADCPWQVLDCLPRRSEIARRSNDGYHQSRRQVLVANVDTALLVMGLDNDFNPRRLERYLALARLAGVASVLVLTKADTVDDAMRQRRISQAREVLPADVELLALDARQSGVNLWLAPWLSLGQTLVLLGSSGAGKSTLTASLIADEGARTPVPVSGSVRADDSRGRHTTTARTLYLNPAGACIIDTPGLRALRLDAEDGAALGAAFEDVARLASQCRFRNCQHNDEPGCAVRAAVDHGRLRNFQKLLREVQKDGLSAAQRQTQARLQQQALVSMWRTRSRASRANRLASGKAQAGADQ